MSNQKRSKHSALLSKGPVLSGPENNAKNQLGCIILNAIYLLLTGNHFDTARVFINFWFIYWINLMQWCSNQQVTLSFKYHYAKTILWILRWIKKDSNFNWYLSESRTLILTNQIWPIHFLIFKHSGLLSIITNISSWSKKSEKSW